MKLQRGMCGTSNRWPHECRPKNATMRGFDRERAGWARCASVPVKVAAVRSGTRPQKRAAPIVDLAQEEASSALFTVYMQ